MAIKLSDYLEKKYLEKVNANGRQYSVAQFAADIGIERGTMSAMMRKKTAQAIDIDNLQALIRYFGKDFTDTFGLTPQH